MSGAVFAFGVVDTCSQGSLPYAVPAVCLPPQHKASCQPPKGLSTWSQGACWSPNCAFLDFQDPFAVFVIATTPWRHSLASLRAPFSRWLFRYRSFPDWNPWTPSSRLRTPCGHLFVSVVKALVISEMSSTISQSSFSYKQWPIIDTENNLNETKLWGNVVEIRVNLWMLRVSQHNC